MNTDLNDRKSDSDIELPEHFDMVKMRPLPQVMPHFFYERDDGTVIDVSEEEAYMIEKNRNSRLRKWGYSDGTACIEYLRNCGVRPGKQIPYEQARKIQEAAYQAELDVAEKKWRVPRHKGGHFDSTITNHQNADAIMRSFGI